MTVRKGGDGIRSVPNQKIVRVKKEPVQGKLFAQMSLEALEKAGQNLDAGAFKLWCYFAKNLNDYQFALSSKDAEETMGIKIKQYNNAIKDLIDKQYLVPSADGANHYTFYDVSQAVIPKEDNDVITKEDNNLSSKDVRNNIYNINNNINADNQNELFVF